VKRRRYPSARPGGEPAPVSIHVTVVEPGYFRRDFLDASLLTVSHARIVS
jgi:hypothetical protein